MALSELTSQDRKDDYIGGKRMKQRAPALPDSATFQQPEDVPGSKLIETAQGNLLYTQGVTGSSPVPPTIETGGSL